MTEFPLTQEQRDSLDTKMYDDIPRVFAPIVDGVSLLKTWTELDEMLPFEGIPLGMGQIVYIIGRSGSGKTSVVINLIKKCIENRRRTLYISLEMSKFQLYAKMLQLYTGHTWKELIRHAQSNGFSDFQRAVADNHIDDYVRFIRHIAVPQHVESLVEEYNPEVVVLDYLQIGPHVERTVRESINKLCKTFNKIKAQRNITILGLSQVARPNDMGRTTVADYFMRPPEIYECRETSEIENSADIVLSIARPDAYAGVSDMDRHKLIVFPAKIRDQLDPDIKLVPIKLNYSRCGVLTDAF